MIRLTFSLASDVGCLRHNNEDMILLNGELFRDEQNSGSFYMTRESRFEACVADGMGGHEGGEFASELATQFFDDFLTDLQPGLTSEQLIGLTRQWAVTTHQRIVDKSLQLPQYTGMGTTFVGLFSYEYKVFSVNIGDSRLYRFRKGILRQLSTDHSVASVTGDSNIPTNVIYNSLGAGNNAFADVEDISDRIMPDDTYLICSDGLSDMLSDTDIEHILTQTNTKTHTDSAQPSANPSTAASIANRLIEAAKQAGGKDNISAILLTFCPDA